MNNQGTSSPCPIPMENSCIKPIASTNPSICQYIYHPKLIYITSKSNFIN